MDLVSYDSLEFSRGGLEFVQKDRLSAVALMVWNTTKELVFGDNVAEKVGHHSVKLVLRSLTVSKLHLLESGFVAHRGRFGHCKEIVVSAASPKKVQLAAG